MRVIVEAFGRAFVLQFDQGKLVTQDEEAVEFEQSPPHDPHSTLSCQVEHGNGADSFISDVMAGRKFGFGNGG